MIDKKSMPVVKRRMILRTLWQVSMSSPASVPLTMRSVALIAWTLIMTVFSYALAVIVLN
ncbi:hypothetical protein [Methylobacterium sp. SI9]|uniref:hypothetical protein n=1 Tax=Methylobacterium guangdongense TaxID=3138811 RepID=UPI00313F34A1